MQQHYRTCTGCSATKPSTLEFFYHNDTCYDNLTTQCKECYRERARVSYTKNYIPRGKKKPIIREKIKGVMYKLCQGCSTFKIEREEFYAAPSNKYGYKTKCKTCYSSEIQHAQANPHLRKSNQKHQEIKVESNLLPVGVSQND